jgi:HPt (histidine-containing phosphotransfer) domain-containing protein
VQSGDGASEQGRTKLSSLEAAYMEDACRTIAKLSSLAEKNDFARLQEMAHYLKGSSLVIGATEVSKLCAKIEKLAAAQKPVLQTVEELSRRLVATSVELSKEYF